MLTIHASLAETELVSMSENVKWSARKRFENGSVELGRIYGYDLINGKLIINPNEAEIIKLVFNSYLEGKGTSIIVKMLNKMNVTGKINANQGWKNSHIVRMLRQEKYIGAALLQKVYYENFKECKNYGKVPQYWVENNHEAIISQENYYKVQELLDEKQAIGRRRTNYGLSPFSSKIKCSECGKSYTRRKNNRNSPYEKWIWCCNTYVQFGRAKCKGKSIRERDLTQLFLSAYNEAVKYIDTTADTVIIHKTLSDLLMQERELITLNVKQYIGQDEFKKQNNEILA